MLTSFLLKTYCVILTQRSYSKARQPATRKEQAMLEYQREEQIQIREGHSRVLYTVSGDILVLVLRYVCKSSVE